MTPCTILRQRSSTSLQSNVSKCPRMNSEQTALLKKSVVNREMATATETTYNSVVLETASNVKAT